MNLKNINFLYHPERDSLQTQRFLHFVRAPNIGVTWKILWLAALISGQASTVFALPQDNTTVMLLSANFVDFHQKKHQGIYQGNIKLDQGTTHIRASSAKTFSNQHNQLIKVFIKGDKRAQAHFWTLTALDKPVTHAYADTMYYYPEKHLIELKGHAAVHQGKNQFKAEVIYYNTILQQVQSHAGNQGPVKIIFYPEKKNEYVKSNSTAKKL